MVLIADLAIYLAATLIMTLTPGNDVVFVASHSLGKGWRVGIFAALGVSFGIIFHILALAFGLSEVLIYYPWTFTFIKILGVSYLLFLAFKAFKNPTNFMQLKEYANMGSSRVFMRGVVNNVLNPKVALFFLAFIPQFINPEAKHVFIQILVLGGIFFIIGTFINLLYAFFFCFTSSHFKSNILFQKLINRVSGIVFCGLAFKMLFA